ncbi:MAG: hypothetical protein AOA65_1351 [Candidatus Bathyarchaeota archaeon BA1]|nr:MAG: hypothetical protein AOA65_1351 [Candidatus Bathyarchaeota archaeon BA1]
MFSLDEALKEIMDAARESKIVREEGEVNIIYASAAKMRFYLIDGSFVDVFVNVEKDKWYYFWLRVDGSEYKVNNFPRHGWHEHRAGKRIPIKPMSPKGFFAKVRNEIRP